MAMNAAKDPVDEKDLVLRRAADDLRHAEVPGWVDISGSIRQRVRAVVRRGRSLRAVTDTGRPVTVTDHVAVALLRQALISLDACELDRVELVGEEDTCTGAVLTIVGRYEGHLGGDLDMVAALVRDIAYGVLLELFGPAEPPFGIDGVDIVVADLVDEPAREV